MDVTFFIYFVFALFSAALRWGSRGTVSTAVVVLVAFTVMGMSLSRTLGPAEFELNRFIIRIVYLAGVAAVLTYLGQHEERLRDEVRRLARWPTTTDRDANTVVPRLLEHSAGILSARRSLLVWSKDDEPWTYIASWPSVVAGVEKQPPGTMEPVVPEPLGDATFLCRGLLDVESSVIVSRADVATTWRGLPVHRDLLPRLTGTGVVSTPFRTEHLSGRVFFAGVADVSVDLVPLVEVVGRELGGSLDQLYAYERAREIAIGEDRIRVARDLHDGVLQSLTGIRLELRGIGTSAGDDPCPTSIATRLFGIERAMAIDQGDLRRFIEGLKPSLRLADAPLAERLDDLRRRMTLEWRTPIAICVQPRDLAVSETLDRAVTLMIHEAIVNALKHGHPSRVSVEVQSVDGCLVVSIEDDGGGFSFRGRHEHDVLVALDIGPVSLRERASSLGGHIAVESSGAGSRVEFSIPLGEAHA
ncbi:MAG: histidine kinase [Acidobacteriota bacterium]